MLDVDFDAQKFNSTLNALLDSLRGKNLDSSSDNIVSLYSSLLERMG